MKTASRIVGTAAFMEGYYAQDFPVYGAERRGAPIMAFTRLSDHPILERGIITQPDINIIADETHGEVATVDITETVLKIVNKPALSSVAAACACKLTGMISRDSLKEAVTRELTDIHLKRESLDKNVEAALVCFDNTPDISAAGSKHSGGYNGNRIVMLKYADPCVGTPSVYAMGNTIDKKTGNWRLYKPVIDYEECSMCRACFVHCPHSCIYIDESGYPQIDYENCKGCFACMDECPKGAISREREVRAW